MPVGTAFHERTFPLCQSLNYREWSGYYAVSTYEVHHEHEYNAIRNATALIDITPLYKYLLTGRDATKLVNRIITRDINKVSKGQVIYCCWCDEIWVDWKDAVKVWDTVSAAGRQFDLHPTGMLALDVARIEAGLLLLDVDYTSSRKALIPSQKFSPYELGFGKMVHLQKENFIGRSALAKDERQGVERQLVGLELDWNEIEALYENLGLTPAAPSQASRAHVPVYAGNRQVGRATSTTWSPVLKKMIALASVETAHSKPGAKLDIEVTIEAARRKAAATVVKLPFFNPARKTAVPV